MIDRTLVLADRRVLTPTVTELTLAATDGLLPEPEPGAHVELVAPSGEARCYSLTRGPQPTAGRWTVAIRRAGRTSAVLSGLPTGTRLRARGPRQLFPLELDGDPFLIAGGIGITPVRAMFHALRAAGRAPELLYLVGTRADAPYAEELSGLSGVTLHTRDCGVPRADLWPRLADPANRRLYVCGPEPLHAQVDRLTAHWRPSRVRAERFAATTDGPAFDAIWAPDHRRLTIPGDRSLLEVLLAAGITVPASCKAGACGTCVLRLHSGEVDHNDAVLDSPTRRNHLMPCVSRGLGTIVVGPV